MQAPLRILVVEDEKHLAFGLRINFEQEGYAVDLAATVREARERLSQRASYDVVVLDVMLPDGNGFEVCRAMRDSGDFTPILALTAKNRTQDRVDGLEAGADDYLTKPFELEELLARIRALVRRSTWDAASATDALAFGRARVDFDRHEVRVDGEPVQLTHLELELLRYFADHAGRVIGRRELLAKVWRLRNWPNTRTVDNFVLRLRRWFEPDPSRPVHFVSVRGAGYMFVPEPPAAG